MKYQYRAVTSSGAGVHGGYYAKLSAARFAAIGLRHQWPDAEVERVLQLELGKRYWLWRGGRWKLFDASDPSAADLAHWTIPANSTGT